MRNGRNMEHSSFQISICNIFVGQGKIFQKGEKVMVEEEKVDYSCDPKEKTLCRSIFLTQAEVVDTWMGDKLWLVEKGGSYMDKGMI